MGDFSSYQKKVINRYYDNRDDIMITKLSEIVTELYLADTAAKQDRLWKRAETAMKNLKIKDHHIAHIMEQRNVEVLAKHLKDWSRET